LSRTNAAGGSPPPRSGRGSLLLPCLTGDLYQARFLTIDIFAIYIQQNFRKRTWSLTRARDFQVPRNRKTRLRAEDWSTEASGRSLQDMDSASIETGLVWLTQFGPNEPDPGVVAVRPVPRLSEPGHWCSAHEKRLQNERSRDNSPVFIELKVYSSIGRLNSAAKSHFPFSLASTQAINNFLVPSALTYSKQVVPGG
jgi:hypothetical protein